MGNAASKGRDLMEKRERTYTECRRSGTLAMNLVREEFNRDIQDVYDLRSGELLGKGGFGTVRVVTHKETKQKFALKTIELKDVETHEQYEFLLNEIEIMKKLDHPNIARVQEVFHTPDHYYMVMDLYTGGDMYGRYKLRSEEDTAKIVGKLINALRYCHDRNVAHRDIKLENICFESMADDAEVKLVDFGLSAHLKEEQLRHDLVGSWPFMAPEVLQRAHHPKACDLWSMGVITYCLFAGYPPFRSVNLKGLKDQILHSEVQFDPAVWKPYSNNAKDFIRKLLTKDPTQRLTAQQAQQHPWLSARTRRWAMNPTLSPQVVDNLLRFKNLNLMKRVALGVVARTLEASEMRTLEQEFHKADSTQSGVIAIEDFHEILKRSEQFKPAEFDDIFSLVDINSSGHLSYTDFTAAALDRQNLDTRRLKYAFERLDHDNNGELDYEDLLMTVGSDLTTEQVRTAIKQFDTKGNGKVTFEDFCKGMRSTGGALDALSTAHLTSGYMLDRIEKGEGVAAIEKVVTELERAPATAVTAKFSSIHSNSEPVAGDRSSLPQKDPLHNASVGADPEAAAAAEPAAIPTPSQQDLQRSQSLREQRCPPVPSPTIISATTPSKAIGAGAGDTRGSSSSSAGTAAPSRPQSLERDGAATMVAAATRGAAAVAAVAALVGNDNLDSEVELGQSAGSGLAATAAAAGGGHTSAGGGAEAAAPHLPHSEEVATAGGARAEAPPGALPDGLVRYFGGEGGLGGGEITRGSLADRRMRDSIKILRGLGTPASGGVLQMMGVAGGAGGVGGHGAGGGINNGISGVAAATGSARHIPSPGIAVLSSAALLGPSAGAGLNTNHDSSAPLPRLSEGTNGEKAPAGVRGAAGPSLGRGRRGPLAHCQPAPASAESGGRPAAGGKGSRNAEFRNGSSSTGGSRMMASEVMPRKKATVADLPPRDSTAGSVDLGWGADGPPEDLLDGGRFGGGMSSGSSQETTGSSAGSRGSRTPKSQQSLRFEGVGVTKSKGKRSGGGRTGNGIKEDRGGGLFGIGGGGGGARRSGGGEGAGGRRQGGPEGDGVHANYNSLDGGVSGVRSMGRLVAFCMPGDDSEGTHLPVWLMWLGGLFGGGKDEGSPEQQQLNGRRNAGGRTHSN